MFVYYMQIYSKLCKENFRTGTNNAPKEIV